MTQADFVTYHLGPQLKADHPDVNIFMFDHNKDHVINWAKELLDPTHASSKFINGTSVHWYAGGMVRNCRAYCRRGKFAQLVS
jgi:glucosylceramidase